MDWLKNLQRFKEERDVTYKSIAEKAELPYATVEKIIKGRTQDPKLLIIYKIVRALGYTLNELMDESGNSAVLSDDEKFVLSTYQKLDPRGRDLVEMVLNHEHERVLSSQRVMPVHKYTRIFYDVPVSAGTGQYLDSSTARTVMLINEPPKGTDYIVYISGNSMEPDFRDGDYVYVHRTESIQIGDIGIFTYAGNVYMKEYTAEGLRSLNPDFSLIPGNEDIKCIGKVLGIVKEVPIICN